jgi:hypothetical protein
MGVVTVECKIVGVRRKLRYSVAKLPCCRLTVHPTELGFAMLQHLSKSPQDIASGRTYKYSETPGVALATSKFGKCTA